jgi:hypothetical protein
MLLKKQKTKLILICNNRCRIKEKSDKEYIKLQKNHDRNIQSN